MVPRQYRERAGRILKIEQRHGQGERIREFQRLEHSFTELADKGDWMANNSTKTVHREDAPSNPKLTEEEGHVLRSLGASVIMQWNTLPAKLQRELFDNASSVGELLQTGCFKQQMSRFVHKHKNEEADLES